MIITAKCELDCHNCKIRDCGFRELNAFSSTRTSATSEALMKHTQTKAQLHVRIDAKEIAKRLKGTSGGGVGIGVPPAVEMEPELYVTDNLKAERNMKPEES